MSSNTIIQILRSYANTTPTTLNNAEQAYSFVNDKLFIGDNTGAVRTIGGAYYTNIIDTSTAASTPNKLALRDGSGNATFHMAKIDASPSQPTDAVNKDWFDRTLSGSSPELPISSNTIYYGTAAANGYSNVHVSANSVSITANNKQIAYFNDQEIAFTDTDVVITANLYVKGTTFEANVINAYVTDNEIVVNSNLTDTDVPVLDAGLVVNRGSLANTALRWNETTKKWQLTNDGVDYYDMVHVNGNQFIENLTSLRQLNVYTNTFTNDLTANNFINSTSANVGHVAIGKTNAYTIENTTGNENLALKTATGTGNVTVTVNSTGEIDLLSQYSSLTVQQNDIVGVAANGIQFSTGTNDALFSLGLGREMRILGNMRVSGDTNLNGNVSSYNTSSPMTIRGYGLAQYSSIKFSPSSTDLNVHGFVKPDLDATWDVGSNSQRWKDIYLSGTAYLPTANVDVLNVSSANITSISAGTLTLVNALATSSGGTGMQSFTANGVFYAGSSSTMNFATGTPFQVLQLSSTGIPVFSGLDGGQF